MLFEGGVLAGVVGTERVLPRVVSMERGWVAGPVETGAPPHSYELPVFPMPIMLEPLVGGVGNVCALSRPGLPEAGCGAIECGAGWLCAPIGFAME